MDLDEGIKNVAVLGAAGKMGSGIALLLLQEIAKSEAEKEGNVGSGAYTLVLVDSNEKALLGLRKYLRSQMTKYAEKNINGLRKYFLNNTKLISNEDIVRAFVEGALDIVCFDTDLIRAKNASLVFEAVVEDVTAKGLLFSTLAANAPKPQYYFTNTSSIPISVLNQQSQLQNRIVGFHFYNPPPVQKLVELVTPKDIDPNLKNIALELAKRLHKTMVHANDIAGFIGNGHFIREVLFACKQVDQLTKHHSLTNEEAIYLINRVTQDFLVRPMGIFQLIDYVGIDVCQNIINIMKEYLADNTIQVSLIENMLAAGVIGGQNPDGSQKNGFFQYSSQAITGVYSLEDRQYHSLSDSKWIAKVDSILGSQPSGNLTWKHLQKEKDKEAKLQSYFSELFSMHSEGAQLGQAFLQNSQEIANHLVKSGVASKLDDVYAVLELGFFHLYGQIPQLANNLKVIINHREHRATEKKEK